MTKPSRNELTADDRRRGGIRSGEVRRKRKQRGWQDALLEAVDADPEPFVRGLLASGNAMAQIKALELATAFKRAELRRREEEIERRARELQEQERRAGGRPPEV